LQLVDIFMTNDDVLNCRFEPQVGSLNPNFSKLKTSGQKPELMVTAATEAAFCEKYGTNLSKKHPEVYKLGVLKKAKHKYRNGEFKKAMDTLATAFKFIDLRRHFEPNFLENQKKKEETKKRQEEAAKLKQAELVRQKEVLGKDPKTKTSLKE